MNGFTVKPLLRPVDRTLFALAVPAFFALVSEPLMLLADTAIVGHLGTTPLAGLAVAATVLNTLVGLCVFLAYGSTAAVARSHGAGDAPAARAIGLSGMWLAAGLGCVLAVATVVSAGALAGRLASSPAVAAQAEIYLAITAVALPAMLMTLAATGALRGELDLRTPLLVTVSANLVNVTLTVVFVYGMNLGIAGAALGTTLAQWCGACWLGGVVVVRARRAGTSTRVSPAAVLTSARDGVPLFVRTLTLRVALVLATVLAARLGDVPLAAHQVATAVVTFLAFGLDALAIAGQTLTGRTLGAGDAIATRLLVRRMVGWGVVTGLVAGVALAAASPVLVFAFTGDDAVRQTLGPVLLLIAALQPISGAVFVLDGLLIGAGDGRYLAVAGTITLAVYMPMAVVLGTHGFAWLWVAYGGFMLTRLVTLTARARSERWIVLGGHRPALP